MKPIDPNMKLDGFLLKDALESIYATFSSVLGGRGTTDCPHLYLREIPEIVFSAAVGAGWVPLADEDFDTKVGTSKGDVVWQADWHASSETVDKQWVLDRIDNLKKKGWQPPAPTTFKKAQAQRIVQFDEFYVERTYLDSFYALLKETISFHLADGTKHEENVKRLPKLTSETKRQALLQEYINQEKAKGNATTLVEVAKRAEVDYSVLLKWRKGPSGSRNRIADTSPAGQRILLLLLFDERNRKRTYRNLKNK